MSIGSCLVANDPSGLAEAMIEARVQNKSWKDIAAEFSLPNPSAARKAFTKYTGITDYKLKRPTDLKKVDRSKKDRPKTGR